MRPSRQESALETVARIYEECRKGSVDQRCLAPPSPQLRAKINREVRELRDHASPAVARLLRAREQNRVGFNDGLIFPGSYFPIGTPAHRVRSTAADRAPLRGVVRVVVVLVDFDDEQFSAEHDNDHYDELFFSEGVLTHGSVREYFLDVTNGLVEITGEVVGPYRMPENLTYYANGDSGTGTAPNARNLAEDAAEASNPDVDFGIYDNDGDGFVDAFIVLQAGPGAESTGNDNHIWSHKWVLPSVFNADGTSIYAYLVVPEEARIGVCCHELGHLLFGFPDLYDTDYSSSGIGDWCLMAGGSWNGNGDIPAHPSAWCKANQEWATVVNQTANATVSIADVKNSQTIYRLWKEGAASDEYFLVENRQRNGYDQHLPGDGLLIWHIDDAVSSNANETHPKVALVQADDQRHLENGDNQGDAGDPYPGSSGNTDFNDTSSPNSRSYGDVETCVAVEGIGASGPVMSAQLNVSCPVTKNWIEDKFPRKEFWKDHSKDHFKELVKERNKELIKDKDKELKEKEFKERKDKDKDIKEWTEFSKPGQEGKSSEKPSEKAPMSEKAPESGQASAASPTIDERLDAIEQTLSAIVPFIHQGLRPDLRQSALAEESDVARTKREMAERAAQARSRRKKTDKAGKKSKRKRH